MQSALTVTILNGFELSVSKLRFADGQPLKYNYISSRREFLFATHKPWEKIDKDTGKISIQ